MDKSFQQYCLFLQKLAFLLLLHAKPRCRCDISRVVSETQALPIILLPHSAGKELVGGESPEDNALTFPV